MDDLVNTLRDIENRIASTDVRLGLEGESLQVAVGQHRYSLALVRLYRPSVDQVCQQARPGQVLILTAASVKAIQAAASTNHIVVPEGNFRIVVPHVALWRETMAPPIAPSSKSPSLKTKLRGRTGIVAETLLLSGQREWSVQELARSAGVSPGLVSRTFDRLEKEGCIETRGTGPEKRRIVTHPALLAEAWSQEERVPEVALRGYLYSSSPQALAQKLLEICPAGAIGGLLAANSYQPVLTRVPFPVRLWVPSDFWLGLFQAAGLEATSEGANVEIVQTKDDTWSHKRDPASRQVSPWRAWLEINSLSGRSEELAQELYQRLLLRFTQGYAWT